MGPGLSPGGKQLRLGLPPAGPRSGVALFGEMTHAAPSPSPSCSHPLQPSSLVLEVLNEVLHVPQFRVQPPPLTLEAVQLHAQVADVVLEEGLQIFPSDTRLLALLLQQHPLGLQHLILLLQEPHLLPPEVRDGECFPAEQPPGRGLWDTGLPTVQGVGDCKTSGVQVAGPSSSSWKEPSQC